MATLLDELVVKIGLDGSAFNTEAAKTRAALTRTGAVARREAKALEDYLKKTQDETRRRIGQVETVGRQASQQFTNMKNNVLGLLGTLAGAYGLQAFFRSIVSGDAALGHFAKTIGVSTEQLATWIEMGKRAGASVDAVRQSFASINQIQQEIALHGQSAATPWFNAMGVALMDAGRARPITEVLKDIGEFARTHPPEQVRAIFSAIGIPPEMIPTLMKGREELNKLEVQMRAQGVATARSAEEDQQLLNKLADLEQIIRDVGRTILSDALPGLTAAAGAMRDWIMVNKDWIEQDINKFFKQIGATVGDLPQHFKDWETSAITVAAYFAGPFLIAMMAGLGPVAAAVAAIAAGLALMKTEGWKLEDLPVGSPIWGGVPRDEQMKYQNSPAYIEQHGYPGGGSGSWIWDKIRSAFGGGRGGASDARLTQVREKLANDPRLGISREAASGLASNLNAESGIRGINEANNGPGFGWAQWTNTQGNPRRTNFESFARGRGLDPSSDEANYEFLVEELRTRYPQVLAQLRRGDISAAEAASIVARGYIVPPADKIPGHVADAERVSKLPTPLIPPTGPVFGPQLPPRTSVDPGYSLALRAPAAGADYSRSSSVETHVNGPIMVNTAATDADGIAKGIGAALQKYAYVPQVNAGLA